MNKIWDIDISWCKGYFSSRSVLGMEKRTFHETIFGGRPGVDVTIELYLCHENKTYVALYKLDLHKIYGMKI